MEAILSNREIVERIYEYSENIGFDTHTDTFKDLISFLVEIDSNFIYCILHPDERRAILSNSDTEEYLRYQLVKAVEML